MRGDIWGFATPSSHRKFEIGHCGCRVSGVPAGRECSGKLRRSAILAVRRTLTGNRGEYLRVVGIHSDG